MDFFEYEEDEGLLSIECGCGYLDFDHSIFEEYRAATGIEKANLLADIMYMAGMRH